MFVLAGLGLFLAACGADDRAVISTSSQISSADISISTVLVGSPSTIRLGVGTDDCLDIQVADSEPERARGLSSRDDLGEIDGMLFVWEEDVEASFYMYKTRFPISIGWYSASGGPIGTAEMQPCLEPLPEDCPLYGPPGKYRYALETGSGGLGGGAIHGC